MVWASPWGCRRRGVKVGTASQHGEQGRGRRHQGTECRAQLDTVLEDSSEALHSRHSSLPLNDHVHGKAKQPDPAPRRPDRHLIGNSRRREVRPVPGARLLRQGIRVYAGSRRLAGDQSGIPPHERGLRRVSTSARRHPRRPQRRRYRSASSESIWKGQVTAVIIAVLGVGEISASARPGEARGRWLCLQSGHLNKAISAIANFDRAVGQDLSRGQRPRQPYIPADPIRLALSSTQRCCRRRQI